MWTSLIAILSTVLEIAREWLTWQVAKTKIETKKLAYDIDQGQLARGRSLLEKIDSARNANDLVATAQLLDDAQANALYGANIRSSVPFVSGVDVGVSLGIPKIATPGSGPNDSVKPVAGAVTYLGTVAAKIPAQVVPIPPYSVTGPATWWGINPNGSNDTGDVDAHGKNLLGAFGDNNHTEQIIGGSIPIIMFQNTIGKGDAIYEAVSDRKYTLDVISHVTGKHFTMVGITDLGPAARLKRPLDLTYAANKMLGHTSGTNLCTLWITGPDGIMEIKGWSWENGEVIS
jgi:hypothetical protein